MQDLNSIEQSQSHSLLPYQRLDVRDQRQKLKEICNDKSLSKYEAESKVMDVFCDSLERQEKLNIRFEEQNRALSLVCADLVVDNEFKDEIIRDCQSSIKENQRSIRKLKVKNKYLEDFNEALVEDIDKKDEVVACLKKNLSSLTQKNENQEEAISALQKSVSAQDERIAKRVDDLVNAAILKHKKAADGRGAGAITSTVVGSIATLALLCFLPTMPLAGAMAATTAVSASACGRGEKIERAFSDLIQQKKGEGFFAGMDNVEADEAITKLKKAFDEAIWLEESKNN